MAEDASTADNQRGIVRSIAKCCALLDCLGHAPDGMNLSQIAEALEIPYSTGHRLLHTLSAYEYVQRDSDTKKYYLGLHILELQANIAKRFRLLETAIPHMTKLIQEMAVTCHLAVLHDIDIVYLESRRSHGDPFFHMHTPPGRTAPAHCTALGKALLAHLPSDTLSQWLTGKQLVALTPNTIVDTSELQQHLAGVRLRGYAVDHEEYSLGVHCVAVPIRCRTGEVIAALSISGRRDQIAPERVEALAGQVIAECDQLSRELGYITT